MSEYQPCVLENPTSPHDLWMLFVIHNVIVLVSFLGLNGNVISGIVLSLPQMRCSYSLLLIALTVSDSIQLVGNIVYFGSQALKYCKITLTPADTVGPTFDKVLSMSAYVAYTASAYLTAVVSFERYTAVCLPFRAHRIFLTSRRSFLYVIAVTAFAVLFNLPKWFETMACQDTIPFRNISFTTDNSVGWSSLGNSSSDDDEPAVHTLGEIRVVYNDLYQYNRAYRVVYLFLANFLINFVIPLAVLIVLNVWMYNEMRKTNQARQLLTVGQINENSITIMLIVVVGIFCVCHMWFAVKILIQEFCGKECVSKVYVEITNFLLTFNASINFVIYCLCGSKFRKQLLLLFSCVKTQRFCDNGGCDGNRNVSTKV